MDATVGAAPVHIAIIPDGNRRWAREHGLAPSEGHRVATEKLLDLAEAVAVRGIQYLTIYAFSTENWRRAQEEVGFLMALLERFVTSGFQRLHERGFRVRFFGSKQGVGQTLLDGMARTMEQTKNNTRATIDICFNYGGRCDLVEAVAAMVREGVAPSEVTEAAITAHLSTAGTPPPDLVIRTSGEQRLSNFLLWEAAYAELMFFDCYWPEFGEREMDEALAEYAKRQRRYGG